MAAADRRQSLVNERGGHFMQPSSALDVWHCASQVKLGPEGVEEFLPLGQITPYEEAALKEAISQLKTNITKGVEFATEKA